MHVAPTARALCAVKCTNSRLLFLAEAVLSLTTEFYFTVATTLIFLRANLGVTGNLSINRHFELKWGGGKNGRCSFDRFLTIGHKSKMTTLTRSIGADANMQSNVIHLKTHNTEMYESVRHLNSTFVDFSVTSNI